MLRTLIATAAAAAAAASSAAWYLYKSGKLDGLIGVASVNLAPPAA